MHVYSGIALEKRLTLAPALGYWFDYWFQLHFVGAPPHWSARPLNLLDLVAATLSVRGPLDANLRNAAKQEWAYLRALSIHIPELATYTAHPALGDNSTQHDWTDFQRQLQSLNTGSIACALLPPSRAASRKHSRAAPRSSFYCQLAPGS